MARENLHKIGRASCRERVKDWERGGAEDGIRDFHVTGVQTCALPICRFEHLSYFRRNCDAKIERFVLHVVFFLAFQSAMSIVFQLVAQILDSFHIFTPSKKWREKICTRSEERRVGKE